MSEAPNPMDRFTSGGWVKGLLRLGAGAVLVAVVVHFFAQDAVALLVEREVTAVLFAGAGVHLAQRAARIAKWRRMIADAGLVERTTGYLLRVQLIGMLANLLLPVSEALKVWAVSKSKRDAWVASESIVIDTALHCAMIGAAGAVGAGWLGAPHATFWAPSGGLLLAATALVGVLAWRNRKKRRMRIADPGVLLWCALETGCQLAIYALAIRAIGVDVDGPTLLALAPWMFLADVVMLTPSGLGLREALFAVVLQHLSGAPADASVAVALLVTTMLFVAAVVGGGMALLLPRAD